MKCLDGLNRDIVDFTGNAIVGLDRDGQTQVRLKFKTALLNHVGGYKAKRGEDAIKAFMVGQKIAQANGKVHLEDAEFDLVKETLGEAQYTALIMGQLYQAMNEATIVQVEGAPEPA